MLVDCHAHLAADEFEPDRAQVSRRALAAGVGAVLVVGEDHADNLRLLARVRASASVAEPGAVLLPCFGLHPDRFADDEPLPTRADIEAVAAQIREHAGEIAAIGEVGLDRWRVKDEARRSAQADLLEQFAALAMELDLPLNVHSRSAGRYALDLLRASGARRVLMHAFDGRAGHALAAAEAGYLFSIPPSVVRSEQEQKLVRRLPLESLCLESDSPVLGPVPGERNEPANLVLARDLIATIHGVSTERVDETTTANARGLFAVLREVV